MSSPTATTPTTPDTLSSAPAGGGVRGRPATFADALRSEWTKFRTLRSLGYTLLVTLVLGVGFGALISNGQGVQYHSMTAEEQAAFDPTMASLQSFLISQLAIGVLGVLVVTSEYATGMIRTSLTAVPRRGRLLAAKATVLAVVALAVGQVVTFGAFLVGQAILAGQGAPHTDLSELDVLRAVIGGGLYLALIGLFSVALGTLIRATAGAITTLVSVTLLVPAFGQALPEWILRVIWPYWPSLAGAQIMQVVPDTDPYTLGPWAGFAALCAWVAVLLAAAFVVFRHRDA